MVSSERALTHRSTRISFPGKSFSVRCEFEDMQVNTPPVGSRSSPERILTAYGAGSLNFPPEKHCQRTTPHWKEHTTKKGPTRSLWPHRTDFSMQVESSPRDNSAGHHDFWHLTLTLSQSLLQKSRFSSSRNSPPALSFSSLTIV